MSATDLERAVTRPIPLVPRLILLSALAIASTLRLMAGSGRVPREHR